MLTTLLLIVSNGFAQQLLTGTVTAKDDQTPLPFVSITSNGEFISTTGPDGAFEISFPGRPVPLTFNYPGYQPQTLTPSTGSPLIVILENLQEDRARSHQKTAERTAEALMERVIAHKRTNAPEEKLESYSFQSYQKSLITADPESIRGGVDSVFKRKNGQLTLRTIDSGAYLLKQRMKGSHLYMNETATRIDFQKEKGRKETILGYQMAGLKKNKYRILTTQLQSFSFYNETYRLERATFKSPLSGTAFSTYNYRIIDTVGHAGRQAYLIRYYSRSKKPEQRMQGALFIDTTSLALQKGIAQIHGDLRIRAEQGFTYYPEKDLWFPDRAIMVIKKGESKRHIPLFEDVLFEVERTSRNPNCIHTNPESTDKKVQFITYLQNQNIQLNQPVSITTRSEDISIDPLSDQREETFWTQRRTSPLTLREQITYRDLDSISGAIRINKRIAFLNKLFRGYVPTKYIDFDLKYLIKYNNYEAFRTGMGATTNKNFSKRLTLKAYGVYGTRDQDFKYGFDAAYKVRESDETYAGINYTDDLTETGTAAFITAGRTFYVFEPRLFNITSFHRSKSGSAYLSHEIHPALQLRMQWTQADTQPTYPYAYLQHDKAYSQFQTNTITVSGYWSPNSRYLVSDEGSTLLEPGWPQFNLQFTKGLKGIMGSDFGFTKVQLRIRQDIHTFAAGSVSLNINAGFAKGELPITELYHVYPNQPTKDALLQRFSVAGYDSFETMYFDEFFSDRFFSLQAKYLLPRIKLSATVKPQIVVVNRYAIGNIRDRESHLGVPFKSLSKGYYESGLEFNNLFSGFGLSTMYRYGPYSLPIFEDNISFKFTFYLSLGI